MGGRETLPSCCPDPAPHCCVMPPRAALLLVWLARLAGSQHHQAGVEVVGVRVPQYGVQGESVTLHCSYTSSQPVYSVRWYKNGKEFFR